jgi:hypothetical protein
MIPRMKKSLSITKRLWYASSAMMGLSAAMFAVNLATGHWVIAGAWFNAGMAWCLVQLKERSLIIMHDLCINQEKLIVIQHYALVKGGIILEEAPEKEAGATQ